MWKKTLPLDAVHRWRGIKSEPLQLSSKTAHYAGPLVWIPTSKPQTTASEHSGPWGHLGRALFTSFLSWRGLNLKLSGNSFPKTSPKTLWKVTPISHSPWRYGIRKPCSSSKAHARCTFSRLSQRSVQCTVERLQYKRQVTTWQHERVYNAMYMDIYNPAPPPAPFIFLFPHLSGEGC